MNKHKHYEVIVAWAEGKPIQFRLGVNDKWIDWLHLPDRDPPSFSDRLDWRIKPTTLKYRTALFKNADHQGYWFGVCNSPSQENLFKTRSDFVRWVTDWIEVEV